MCHLSYSGEDCCTRRSRGLWLRRARWAGWSAFDAETAGAGELSLELDQAA
jgi:hypothetical protein